MMCNIIRMCSVTDIIIVCFAGGAIINRVVIGDILAIMGIIMSMCLGVDVMAVSHIGSNLNRGSDIRKRWGDYLMPWVS